MACVHDPSILVLKQESASVVFKSITVALPNIFLRALRLKIMYGTALYIYIYICGVLAEAEFSRGDPPFSCRHPT